MKYNKYFIFILMVSILMLSACSMDDEDAIVASSEVDLSEYPIGVQEGDISAEYYDTVMNTLSCYFDTIENVKKESEVEKKKDIYMAYLVKLNGLNYTFYNNNEQEIDNYFSSFLFNTKLWAKSRISHLDTNSDIDNSVSVKYFNDTNNDIEMFIKIMESHNLSEY